MAKNNTLVTFHIGRGGRFHNSGHLSFVECGESIEHYTNDLFLNFENWAELYRLTKKRYLPNFQALIDRVNDNLENPAPADIERIKYFTGIELGELYYCDTNGIPLLPLDNDGTGMLEKDQDYDTTYVQDISDCNEEEIRLILESDYYLNSEIEDYIQSEHADIWSENKND